MCRNDDQGNKFSVYCAKAALTASAIFKEYVCIQGVVEPLYTFCTRKRLTSPGQPFLGLRAMCIQPGEKPEHGIKLICVEFFEIKQIFLILYDVVATDGIQRQCTRVDSQNDQASGGDAHAQISFYLIIQIKNPLDKRRRHDFEEGVTIL